jgi:Calx-beta domain/Right handed beta helix region
MRTGRSVPAVLLTSLSLLAAAPIARAQLPSCGSIDRHFDPGEVPAAPVGSGPVFYVDGASGSDTNDGLSEGMAFKTIGKGVSGLTPGATLLIKAGLYREQVSIRRSGTAANRIVVGAFGNGPVIVDASAKITGWTNVGGQVYRAPVGFAVRTVVVDDTPLLPEFSQGALSDGRFYWDSAAGNLYVWAPGGGNPSSRDVGVLKDDEYEAAIFLNPSSYLTLYGLTVRFSGGHGVTVLGDFVRVEKCRLRFNGKSGVSTFGYGGTATKNTEIIKNEIYHNMLRNWPRGLYKYGAWAPGALCNATPNILYQGNVVYKNGGEGLLAVLGPGGAVFRDNIVYDNWSVNIYVDNHPNATVENNLIYSHPPDPQDLHNNEDPDPDDLVNLKHLRPDGILTADENYGTSPPSTLKNVTIRNNVILNCRRGVGHYGSAPGSGLKNVSVLHNTIVVPDDKVPGENIFAGIFVPYNGGNNVGSVYRGNLVYATDPTSYVLFGETPSASVAQKFLGVTLDHNLWHHTVRSDPFLWGPDVLSAFEYTHDEWLALSGTAHGAGDVTAGPLLVNPSTLEVPADKMPTASSPALNSGVAAGVTLDYDFCPRPEGDTFDIGAYELATGIPLPSVSIGNAAVTEGKAGTTASAVFTVSLSAPSAHPVYVKYATAPGTAAAAIDYLTTSGTLTFAPGTSAKTLAVTVKGDATIEPDETFSVNLSAPEGAVLADAQGVGTIHNDDFPAGGFLQFSAPAYTVAEAGGSATITVVRTGNTPPVTVRYLASTGTATLGSDFKASAGVLSFGAGVTSKTFSVPILNDTLDEADETVKLSLSLPTGGAALGAPNPAILTIVDDDVAGVLAFSSAIYAVTEGASPTALITVTRTGGAASGVSVRYATSNGTALAGKDYYARVGSLIFGAGVTSATFAIPILNDTIVEGDETVTLTLSLPTGRATLGATSSATLTIHSDDLGGVLAFSAPALVVSEVGVTALLTVTRTGGVASGVSVHYATSDGTALAGADYLPRAGTLLFGAGVTKAAFAVTIKRDTLVEPDETLNVTLSAPAGGASLGAPSTAVVTITEKSVVNFTAAAYAVLEPTPLARIMVKRTGGTLNSVTVQYATSNGTATAGADYTAASGTLTFPVGVAMTSFTVPILNDTTHEAKETVNLTLTAPGSGAALGPTSQAVLSITDNDP